MSSWYGADFHGKQTASGLMYDMYGYTCAHKTLPLGSLVEFTNSNTGYSRVLWVTDRGPYVSGRDFDLSYKAFKTLVGDPAIGVDDTILRYKVVGRNTSKMLWNV